MRSLKKAINYVLGNIQMIMMIPVASVAVVSALRARGSGKATTWALITVSSSGGGASTHHIFFGGNYGLSTSRSPCPAYLARAR